MTTALKPNTRPVLIVPKFATNAATTCRNAFPRSSLLLNEAGAGCVVDLTTVGVGPFTNVWESALKLKKIKQKFQMCPESECVLSFLYEKNLKKTITKKLFEKIYWLDNLKI